MGPSSSSGGYSSNDRVPMVGSWHLRYWVCLGGIILVESISLSTLLFHFPLWYIAKVALVLYLQMEKCPVREYLSSVCILVVRAG